MNHVPVGQSRALFVIHIPPERFEERIHKIHAQRGFIVFGAFVDFDIALKLFDKFQNLIGRL